MFTRYRRSEDGSIAAKALVYTAAEHGIDRSRIDPDAIRIIDHLRNNGHEGYIVGGAVRDLLVGRTPKDFDLVTDAQPPRIRRIFRNSRVIGRRFRLVHVYIGSTIYEVSTFRSIASGTVGNEFGTMDEDALRRDFTLNALYYDTRDDTLIDYVGGFKDVKSCRIEPVIPLETIFVEDPVRMIRCLKYASTSGFRVPFGLRRAIKRDANLLSGASASRLTEEFSKILSSGNSAKIMVTLNEYALLSRMVPALADSLQADAAFRKVFFESLEELDSGELSREDPEGAAMRLAHVCGPWLKSRPGLVEATTDSYRDALVATRNLLLPLNFPRVHLESAVLHVFHHHGLAPVHRSRRDQDGPDGETGVHNARRRSRRPRAD